MYVFMFIEFYQSNSYFIILSMCIIFIFIIFIILGGVILSISALI